MPESHSKDTREQPGMGVSSSCKGTYTTIYSSTVRVYVFFLSLSYLCNATEVVERGKARQVDKNIIWSSELLPSRRGVDVFTWRRRGVGR